jgi:Skp family chaperone for outer membrane proteins
LKLIFNSYQELWNKHVSEKLENIYKKVAENGRKLLKIFGNVEKKLRKLSDFMNTREHKIVKFKS